ncbi:MAG: tRNA pseudouridine(55) synthase TruB [Mycoplasma sp.]
MQNSKTNLFAIDKPLNITSNKLIQKIKFACKIKKIGHGGTLDPMATGVMIIGINNGTKNLTHQLNDIKKYEAKIEFGYLTETFDLEGEIIKRKDMNPTLDSIIKCCETLKNGPYHQTVPLYSAVKIDGKELYKHARNGNVDVVPPTKEVNLIDYQILSFENNILTISLTVSKGFYIRSFANDLGIMLDGYATLIGLIRTMSGDFKIEDAYSVDDFIEMYNKKSI